MRQKITRVARRMAELGLVRGSSGNVSVRRGDTVLITPSGIVYERLHPSQ
ncbi:MAG TPA: class II aldolase/adducin family protein, partial [Candidatus Acetothermia bacterium]|nr:class II aldolase/adducin family protein [Candidatus Acetothermia bacterium]